MEPGTIQLLARRELISQRIGVIQSLLEYLPGA